MRCLQLSPLCSLCASRSALLARQTPWLQIPLLQTPGEYCIDLLQGKEVHMFYAVSRRKCWWQGEGGMHWACGGNVMMQSSSDSGCTWSSPKVCPLQLCMLAASIGAITCSTEALKSAIIHVDARCMICKVCRWS